MEVSTTLEEVATARALQISRTLDTHASVKVAGANLPFTSAPTGPDKKVLTKHVHDARTQTVWRVQGVYLE